MSEQRKYVTFTAQRKLEIVLAGLRGDRSVKDVCREHAISGVRIDVGSSENREASLAEPGGKARRSSEQV